jgi:hypothetical protein
MLADHKVNLMQCPYMNCGRKFKDEWKLKRHLVSNKDHAQLGTFQCLTDSIKQHCLVTPQKIGQFPCPLCQHDINNPDLVIQTESPAASDQQAVISNFLNKNTDNSLYFDKFEELREHVVKVHPSFSMDNYFVCKQCGQVFLNRYKLSCHLFNVHSGKRKRRSVASSLLNRNKINVASFMNLSNQIQMHQQSALSGSDGAGGAFDLSSLIENATRGNSNSTTRTKSSAKKLAAQNTLSSILPGMMLMTPSGQYTTPAKFLLEKKFPCVVCTRKFKRVRDLQSHVQIMHKKISDEQREQLKVDIEKTNSLIAKAKSMRNKKSPAIMNNLAAKSFLIQQQQQLQQHEHQQQQQQASSSTSTAQSSNLQLVKVCFICSKVFKMSSTNQAKNDKTFMRHMQIQHGLNEKGERLIDCPVCEKWFFNRQQMERHMRTHQVWIHDPSLGGAGGGTSADLTLRNETSSSSILPDCKDKHSILYCHECTQCQTFFKSLKVLTKHKRDVHNLKPIFKCCTRDENTGAVCNVQCELDDVETFLEHAKVHSQKNIACTKCQTKFASKNSLRNHMKNVHYKINTVMRKRVARPRKNLISSNATMVAASTLNSSTCTVVNLSNFNSIGFDGGNGMTNSHTTTKQKQLTPKQLQKQQKLQQRQLQLQQQNMMDNSNISAYFNMTNNQVNIII